MPKNNHARRTPTGHRARHIGSTAVPRPRASEKSVDPDPAPAAGGDRYLLTERDLLILVITLVVGLLAATVTGLTVGMQTRAAIGVGPSIALAIASGVVTLVVTGLVVANRLHKLVR